MKLRLTFNLQSSSVVYLSIFFVFLCKSLSNAISVEFYKWAYWLMENGWMTPIGRKQSKMENLTDRMLCSVIGSQKMVALDFQQSMGDTICMCLTLVHGPIEP